MADRDTRTNLIDEGTLLAWIEGQLDPLTHERVSSALDQAPDLRERVERMRADREALRTMPDEPAPPGLLAGVADVLEREMLVGASPPEDDGLAEPPPDPTAAPERDAPGFPRFTPRHWLPLAASIAIAAGAAAFLAHQIAGENGTPGTTPGGAASDDANSPGPMAMGDAESPGVPQASPTAPGPPSLGTSSSDGRASAGGATTDAEPEADESAGEPGERAKAPGGDADTAGRDQPSLAREDTDAQEAGEQPSGNKDESLADKAAASTAPARAQEQGSEAQPDMQRLARLAAEGRLVIRVRTRLPEATNRRVSRIGQARDSVRVSANVPTALASAIEPTPSEAYPRRGLEAPAVADTSGDTGDSDDAPASRLAEGGEPAIAGLYLMEMDLDADTLRRALETLSEPVGQDAAFEVVEASRLERVGLPPASASERLLWWTGEPSQWVPRGNVPVVIETLREQND